MSSIDAATIQKYAKYSISQLVQKAQKRFNAWIRKRDIGDEQYFTCISCGKTTHRDQANASHYMSAGNHQSLRFHEDNVWASCIRCNKWLSGNLIEYRKRLVEKIGPEKVEWLETYGKSPVKLDKITLIQIIEKYK